MCLDPEKYQKKVLLLILSLQTLLSIQNDQYQSTADFTPILFDVVYFQFLYYTMYC